MIKKVNSDNFDCTFFPSVLLFRRCQYPLALFARRVCILSPRFYCTSFLCFSVNFKIFCFLCYTLTFPFSFQSIVYLIIYIYCIYTIFTKPWFIFPFLYRHFGFITTIFSLDKLYSGFLNCFDKVIIYWFCIGVPPVYQFSFLVYGSWN